MTDAERAVQEALRRLNQHTEALAAATTAWAQLQTEADRAMVQLTSAHADVMRAVVAFRAAQAARLATIETTTAAAVALVTQKPQA